MMSENKLQLLHVIGKQVRGLRAKRGMTRKMLARESAISERYLAQLEHGEGNISISLLNQVAAALQVELTELIHGDRSLSPELVLINNLVRELNPDDQQTALQLLYEKFSQDVHQRQRYALLGLRGAGKTTLGKLLAQHYGIPFISLVDEIEKSAGMGVSEIFSLSGQAGYRRLEERVLTDSIQKHQCCVIETGGSIVAEPRLLNLLLTSCLVIWIKTSPQEHMRRVIDQGDLRPMAHNDDAMADLQRILEERNPYYAKAHVTVDTAGKTVDSSFHDLLGILPVVNRDEDLVTRAVS